MNCDECDKTEEKHLVIYYRLGTATIGIIACPTHGKQALDILNKGQGCVLCGTRDTVEELLGNSICRKCYDDVYDVMTEDFVPEPPLRQGD